MRANGVRGAFPPGWPEESEHAGDSQHDRDRKPVIDVHVHLAGLGTDGSGCCVSPRMARSPVTWYMLRKVGVGRFDPHADARYAQHVIDLVEAAEELDYACLFALDGVYDAHGELDRGRSHLMVPNPWVFAVCAKSPRLLPVISINPARRDALGELERWGPHAVALKWLAPLQRFDPSEARYAPFIARLRDLGLPVIAHSGSEHTFPGMVQRLGDPALYEPLLEAEVPVVFSHCGSGSALTPRQDRSEAFLAMLTRYGHAYGDSSALGSVVRARALHRLRRWERRAAERVLHGSDYPTPGSCLPFGREIGWGRAWELERKVRNPLDRDVRLKRALGLPEAGFTGAWELLGDRVRRWEAVRAGYAAPV